MTKQNRFDFGKKHIVLEHKIAEINKEVHKAFEDAVFDVTTDVITTPEDSTLTLKFYNGQGEKINTDVSFTIPNVDTIDGGEW